MKPLKADRPRRRQVKTKPRVPAKRNGVPSEHEFNVSMEQWDESVFVNAKYFTVANMEHHTVIQFESFFDALLEAKDDPRSLVYAVAGSGRSTCLVRNLWERYLRLWADKLLEGGDGKAD